MKIFNIRKNFATNSSSSHSVLCLPESKNNSEKNNIPQNDVSSDYYGWDYFTASATNSKLEYLFSCVFDRIANDLFYKEENKEKKYDEIQNIAFKKTKKYFPELDFIINNVEEIKTVDHQSTLLIPYDFNNKQVNKEYIEELKNYFIQDNIIILGGNDNDDKSHPLYKEEYLSIIEKLPKETNNWKARKTKSLNLDGEVIGEHWVLFNNTNGNKIKLSFDDSEPYPKKSEYPELADICITSFCPYECEYCYQDSTVNGQHADINNIKYIAQELSKYSVFEVAIGGGEPTLHPQFKEIAKIFNDNNIVFNFTTKNLAFLKNPENKDFLMNDVGAVAYSISSYNDVQKLCLLSEKFPNKITAQIVMGIFEEKEFEKIIETLSSKNITATLLGYKDIGRGNDFKPYDYSNWLKIIKKTYINVNIDTKLTADFKEELIKEKVHSITYHTTEGASSIYIDATKMKMYPSSYVGIEKEENFDKNWVEKYKHYYIEVSNKLNNNIKKISIKSLKK